MLNLGLQISWEILDLMPATFGAACKSMMFSFPTKPRFLLSFKLGIMTYTEQNLFAHINDNF